VRKQTAYIETSIWGAIVNDKPDFFREGTLKLLNRTDEISFYISPVVIREVSRAAPFQRGLIEELIDSIGPGLLGETGEILNLANLYVERKLFSEKYRDDAMHVAYASYHDMDYLVSYNFRHIVRVNRKNIIKATNSILGYHTPEIVSAEELAEEVWGE